MAIVQENRQSGDLITKITINASLESNHISPTQPCQPHIDICLTESSLIGELEVRAQITAEETDKKDEKTKMWNGELQVESQMVAEEKDERWKYENPHLLESCG